MSKGVRAHAVRLSVLVAWLAVPVGCHGQTSGAAPMPLPDAALQERSGSMHGSVTDQDGSLLPGARVEISSPEETLTEVADSEGEFRANGLLAGVYTVRVVDSGFVGVQESVAIASGEAKELEPIQLRMLAGHSDVSVVASLHEIAAVQVAEEEKQRVFGAIPNFYVVYAVNPAPLSKGQKFHLAWRSTFDPVSFLGTGVVAGIGQATNQFPGYGQGAAGYGKRYGAAMADGVVSGFLGGAVLPMIFRQDPRYYYQGTGSVWSRTKHAVTSIVICHGDNGKLQFNYSNVIGNFAAAGISNVYYPASDRHGAGLTMQNAAIGTAFGAFAAVMQEFVVRKLTPHLPSIHSH